MTVRPRVLWLLVATGMAGLAGCTSTPAAAPAVTGRPSAAPAHPAAQPTELVPVKLSTLDTSGRQQAEPARNPFRYQPKVVAAPPKPADTPRPQQVQPMPVPPPVPAGPPPIQLKFLGVVTRSNGVRWAVLSDGKLPIYGRETDIIGGQYRILSIGSESIEIAYADGRGRQTLKLSGQ
jgi:hypothetical protein